MSLVIPHHGVHPRIHESAFVAPTATIIGDVEIGEDASIWFGTVVRGDVFHIRIGARSNVQDLTMVHVTTGRHATILEDDVTVGHRVTLHGCTLRRGCLVGMGATVMDEAEVGEWSLIGAGSLLTPGTKIPPGVLAFGSPCKVRRELTDAELENLRRSAPHYVNIAKSYR
jgi:carbonic anhydrase/acetyltransferase-like protein (isoleucine patch superfamily)